MIRWFQTYYRMVLLVLAVAVTLFFVCVGFRSCRRPALLAVNPACIVLSDTSTPAGPDQPRVRHVTTATGPAGDRLEIQVPPSPDTVRIIIDDRLVPRVLPGPDSTVPEVIITRRSALITWSGEFGFCVLAAPPPATGTGSWSVAPGVKLRTIEVWRISPTAYLTLPWDITPGEEPVIVSAGVGLGAGLDYRLTDRLTLDVACLWRVLGHRSNSANKTYSYHVGISFGI